MHTNLIARIMPAVAACAIGLFTSSCRSVSKGPCSRDFPLEQIRAGDLAFRCGQGLFSRVVTLSEEEGIYSHVGVIVPDGDVWKVVHAVPGERQDGKDFDRVKAEDIEVFFAPGRAVKGCLVHTGLSDSTRVGMLCRQALQQARDSVPFDDNYSLEDSTALYCTELVWRLYLRQGVDLTQGRRRYVNALQIKGDVILPEHILHYSENEQYYHF